MSCWLSISPTQHFGSSFRYVAYNVWLIIWLVISLILQSSFRVAVSSLWAILSSKLVVNLAPLPDNFKFVVLDEYFEPFGAPSFPACFFGVLQSSFLPTLILWSSLALFDHWKHRWNVQIEWKILRLGPSSSASAIRKIDDIASWGGTFVALFSCKVKGGVIVSDLHFQRNKLIIRRELDSIANVESRKNNDGMKIFLGKRGTF